MLNIDGEDTKVFRKFLSDMNDSFVSVTSNSLTWEGCAEDGDSVENKNVSVTLNLGTSLENFELYYNFDNHGENADKEYTKAMDELGVLKAGINAAMDEIADAYGDVKYNALEDEEQLKIPFDE